MRIRVSRILFWVGFSWSHIVWAQVVSPHVIPERSISPPASVSAELKKFLGQPLDTASPPPTTLEEWKLLTRQSVTSEQTSLEALASLRERFGVTVVPEVMGGVSCYWVLPKSMPRENHSRLLFNLHHGGFLWGGGESGTEWGIELAGLLKYRVLVVDYRLLPEHPFPDALDDMMSAWKAVTKTTRPQNIAVIGGSVGGGMVLSLVQRAKTESLPLPASVISISPASADLSKTGDTQFTHAGIDGTNQYDGFWAGVWQLYANGHDLKDPQLSPLYADFKGFPPTYLVSGTRDVFLSDAARVQRKILQADGVAEMEVVEGLPHAGFLLVDVPEVSDMYSHVRRFLDDQFRRAAALEARHSR